MTLRTQFAHEDYGDISSVLGVKSLEGQQVRILVETHFAASWPKEVPKYE